MKKRALSLILALALCLGLLPMTALAAEGPYDVYQADGFYITAQPYKLNSTKYVLPPSNGSSVAGDSQFHDGLIMVYANMDSDENYVDRQYVYELNWADRNGNIVLPAGSLKANAWIYDLSANRPNYCFAVSEGILAYWDGEAGGSSPIYGFMDTSGTILTPCRYSYTGLHGFRDGVNVVYNKVSEQRECIDTRGNVLFTLNRSDPKTSISIFSPYVDGLAPGGMAVYDSANNAVRSYGFLNKQGEMVLKLVSSADTDRPKEWDIWQMCAGGKTDGYLLPLGAAMGSPEIGGKYGLVSGFEKGGFSEATPYATTCVPETVTT